MEISAGAAIINGKEVLIIKDTEGNWGFPKGHLLKGETEEEAAKREIKEEVGLEIELLDLREEIEYIMPNGIKKRVIYFLALPITKDVKIQPSEVLESKWMDIDEARKTLTFDDLRDTFSRLLEKLPNVYK